MPIQVDTLILNFHTLCKRLQTNTNNLSNKVLLSNQVNYLLRHSFEIPTPCVRDCGETFKQRVYGFQMEGPSKMVEQVMHPWE